MFKNTLSALLVLLMSLSLHSQELVSSQWLGSKTANQLAAEFGFPFVPYGARYYHVTYTSHDLDGTLDTLSGLIAVPDAVDKIFPRLVYQHGTSSDKQNVPSRYTLPGGSEGGIAVFFAGMGFVSMAPDYLGLGVSSDQPHPYVHAASEAWVALDLLRALPGFAAQNNVHVNDQLFVTGYSQGGHGSMALHKAVETEVPNEFSITAAAHLSGPYSISGVMRSLILAENVYYFPAYIPNTAWSYQSVYGNLFSNWEQAFRQPYASTMEQFSTNTLSLGAMNDTLINQLISNEGACLPSKMLQDSTRDRLMNDPTYAMNVAMRDNDLYNWAPQQPTRIFTAKPMIRCLL
ncbi:MAG: hypothetical protein IPL65_05455 [Lewinellaceae bacterium]|nr:hypothetical protein [Lewinellaceae bacterium]